MRSGHVRKLPRTCIAALLGLVSCTHLTTIPGAFQTSPSASASGSNTRTTSAGTMSPSGATTGATPNATTPASVPTSVHASASSTRPRTQSNRRIAVIVFENHGYSQIIGSSDAPYLNSLASRYGLATSYHAVSHPSLPNYLALIGGDTFGITDDCTSCSVNATSLGDQLDHAGVSWNAFMEGLPSPCFTGSDSGNYAKRHDPFVYFKPFVNESDCAQHVVSLSNLDATNLPSFSFISPDLCHDMHDCSVSDADHWLKGFLPSIINNLNAHDVVVLTFDEDDGNQANRVATIVISPQISGGKRSSQSLSHYSLLRSIEDTFGLPALGHAASASPLLPAFGL